MKNGNDGMDLALEEADKLEGSGEVGPLKTR